MRKNFQIKLEPKAHAHLKFRAKQLGLTLGELIENLISLMEIRIEKSCKILNIQEGLIDDVLLKIFLKDGLKIDKNDLKEELNKVRIVKPNGFKPEITV